MEVGKLQNRDVALSNEIRRPLDGVGNSSKKEVPKGSLSLVHIKQLLLLFGVTQQLPRP